MYFVYGLHVHVNTCYKFLKICEFYINFYIRALTLNTQMLIFKTNKHVYIPLIWFVLAELDPEKEHLLVGANVENPIFTIWWRNIKDFFTLCCLREILKLVTLLRALFLSSITSNKEGLWPSKTESARMSMADAMMFMTSNSNSWKGTNYMKERRYWHQ